MQVKYDDFTIFVEVKFGKKKTSRLLKEINTCLYTFIFSFIDW